MAWLISEALMRAYENSHCLPEQEAEYSADICSDGEPLPPLNGPRIQRVYLPQDKMTDFSRLSRFGMMFRPLTEDHGADVLTWYLAGFPVRTLAQQDEAQESMGSGRECGRTWRELLAKYDRNLSLWKTPQCSLLEDSDEFSETWPRSGTMRNGCVYQRESVALRTDGTESGFWPTPRASDHKGSTRPDAMDKAAIRGFNPNLPEAVGSRKWPTPCASMSKGSSPESLTRKNGRDRSNDRLDHCVMALHGGQLNPTWVEWLMGWPLGWTGLKPLETDRFREWQQQHFLSFTGE